MAKHIKEAQASSSQDSQRGKKEYRSPELVEWGSIMDLTHGPKNPFEDFPAKGGTRSA